jgi:DNA-directed RNA polymerase specialized sigma24 family protein
VALREPAFQRFVHVEDPTGLWVAEAESTVIDFASRWMRQRFWYLAQLFIRPARRAALYRAVRDLPADQRRVIEMRFAEGRTIAEIARMLGRSEGAVKQLQFRALGGLRTRLDQDDA